VTRAQELQVLAFSELQAELGNESLVDLCQQALDGERPAKEELWRSYGDEIKAQGSEETG
jgi:hypothetical protein